MRFLSVVGSGGGFRADDIFFLRVEEVGGNGDVGDFPGERAFLAAVGELVSRFFDEDTSFFRFNVAVVGGGVVA